jgi:hypothetical protein
MKKIPMVQMYVSAWGQFVIPPKLFASTSWRTEKARSWSRDGAVIVLEAHSIPENWPFFKWLHLQEVKAGKPK